MSLWQKPDGDHEPSKSFESTPQPTSTPRHDSRMDAPVNIGPSIEIKGELSGNEDLIIDGKVDGKIVLQEHSLTIGANAKIKADVRAKSVLVIGEVFGNITADDKIEIASSGSVEGDLTAPRVALADGSSFKGGIDMACKTSTVGQTPSSVTSRVPMAASPSK